MLDFLFAAHLRVTLRAWKCSNVTTYMSVHVLSSGPVICPIGTSFDSAEEAAPKHVLVLSVVKFASTSRKLMRPYLEPAEDRNEGEDSVLIETPVLMSIRRSRGP